MFAYGNVLISWHSFLTSCYMNYFVTPKVRNKFVSDRQVLVACLQHQTRKQGVGGWVIGLLIE
jgi:hypothetical protein